VFHFQNVEAWATILALAWLQTKFADRRDDWLMLAENASDWLRQQDTEGKTLKLLNTQAVAVLGK
jgi:hypothetical protein